MMEGLWNHFCGHGRSRSLILVLLAVLALGGCKTDLYGALEEREANEMVAVLSRHNIPAVKLAVKDNLFNVKVEENVFARSVDILSREGYPRRKFGSFSDVIESSGLIPTPFEERIRYLYGISEELAHTISLLEGVVDTRVHVALPPESSGLSQQNAEGKASVYIKYDARFDFTNLMPQIKKLVSDSVDSVTYANVEVLALPTALALQGSFDGETVSFLGVTLNQEDYNRTVVFLGAVVALVLALAAALGWALWRTPPLRPQTGAGAGR